MSKTIKLNKESLRQSIKIFRFIKPYKWSFILGMICLVISSSMFMIFPGAAGEMANAAIGKGKWNIKVEEFGLIFLVILIVQGVLSYFRTTFLQKLVNTVLQIYERRSLKNYYAGHFLFEKTELEN